MNIYNTLIIEYLKQMINKRKIFTAIDFEIILNVAFSFKSFGIIHRTSKEE